MLDVSCSHSSSISHEPQTAGQIRIQAPNLQLNWSIYSKSTHFWGQTDASRALWSTQSLKHLHHGFWLIRHW